MASVQAACARAAIDLASDLDRRMAALRQVLAETAPPSAANP
jgi:hypothetical protein